MDPTTTGSKLKFEQNMKYVSLVLLVFFTSAQILCMRYARTREDSMYDSNTAVLLGEVLKLIMSFLLLSSEKGGTRKAYGQLELERTNHQRDVLLHAVPALLYTIQNNFMYLAISNLDAAVFQVCSQLKLITAAIFSVTFLKKHISSFQWLSLFILGVGLVLVNLRSGSSADLSENTNMALGLFSVLVFCCTSGFAGVFMEKLFKDNKFSVWSRNIWLALFSILSGVLGIVFKDWRLLLPSNFFKGYSFWAWLAVILLAIGGLIIAMVLKYADNIIKAFGNAASIVLSTFLSVFLFDFVITSNYICGCILVIIAIVMYSSGQKK